MIIIVFGLPGTGKSYFASHLAKKLNGDYINSDKVRKELFPKPQYTEAEKEAVYKSLLNNMYDHVKSREPLIIDGTFYKQNIRDNFNTLAKDLSIDVKWIEITADEEMVRKRVSKKRPFSDADFEVYQKVKQQFDPFKGPHLVLTSKNIDQMLDEALQFIATTTPL